MGWYRADILGTRLAFTDRRGGVSSAPYDSLNVGLAQADERSSVIENRRRALAFLGTGAGEADWVPIEQVHGADVVMAGPVPPERVPADAVVVDRPGPVAGVVVADCAPVALVGTGAAAAVHAGWPGLEAGVLGAAVDAMRAIGVRPTTAVLGPCVRPCCYEFGEDLLERVEVAVGTSVRGVTTHGAPALDIPAAVRASLSSAGVERVVDVGRCTACSPDYFSHRRDGGQGAETGRQALLVTLAPS